MMVLSLSSSWAVSIEGMVPDNERWRVILVVVVRDRDVDDEGERQMRDAE
jgi:hypothetical protein